MKISKDGTQLIKVLQALYKHYRDAVFPST